MTAAEPFLRAALFALAEAGDLDPGARAILEQAIAAAAPLASVHKPASARKQIAWAATQMAMSADNPARAYSRLRELLAALFEPIAGARLPAAPAPEVALTLAPRALLDALVPAPRVLARDLAVHAKLDTAALLVDPAIACRVLGIRSIPQTSIGGFSRELAAILVGDLWFEIARAREVGSDPAPPTASPMAEVETAILRAEAIRVCVPAAEKSRAKIVSALSPYLTASDGSVRAAAIDGLHALRAPLDDAQLFTAMFDPAATVRAAAARTFATGPFDAANPRRFYAKNIEARIIALLGDVDPAVRGAALGALARYPSLHGARLVEPLRTLVGRGDDDARSAIYLLGRLGAQATTAAIDIARALATAKNPHQAGEALIAVLAGDASVQVVELLRSCVAGPRSSAAYTASVVLDKLGVAVSDPALEVRLARAADELASNDRDVQWSGLFEAKRIGKPATPLIPAILAIAEQLATDTSAAARSTFVQLLEVLGILGVADDDLPRPPSRLEAYRGISPREVEIRGAYAIASLGDTVQHGAVSVPVSSLGLWDNGTGKRLFVVERAELLAFVPGRTEVAVIRTEVRHGARHGGTSRNDLTWYFERYTVPGGERVGSITVASALTYGWPEELAIAAELATVWCGDENAPYRFHIKLGDPDLVIDEAPHLGKRSRKK